MTTDHTTERDDISTARDLAISHMEDVACTLKHITNTWPADESETKFQKECLSEQLTELTARVKALTQELSHLNVSNATTRTKQT
jgi:hypothetical protein